MSEFPMASKNHETNGIKMCPRFNHLSTKLKNEIIQTGIDL